MVGLCDEHSGAIVIRYRIIISTEGLALSITSVHSNEGVNRSVFVVLQSVVGTKIARSGASLGYQPGAGTPDAMSINKLSAHVHHIIFNIVGGALAR